MSMIKTDRGWKRLWTLSAPQMPRIGWRSDTRPGDEEWIQQQWQELKSAREGADWKRDNLNPWRRSR